MIKQQRNVVVVSHGQWKAVRAVLADGATDTEAAKRLGLRPDTIKSHMRAVFALAGCQSRAQLAVRVWSGQLDLVSQQGGSLLEALEAYVASAA